MKNVSDMGEHKLECSDCGAEMIVPKDFIVGEIISCKDCGSDWEITNIKLDLVKTEKIGEDWGQ